jgi:hypothetical protein
MAEWADMMMWRYETIRGFDVAGAEDVKGYFFVSTSTRVVFYVNIDRFHCCYGDERSIYLDHFRRRGGDRLGVAAQVELEIRT